MSEKEINENDMQEKEKAEQVEKIRKRTIDRMFAGARQEQKSYDELKKLRKDLKFHLEVLWQKILYIYLIIILIQALLMLDLKKAGRKLAENKLDKLNKYGTSWSREDLKSTLDFYGGKFIEKYLCKK